MKVLRAIAVGLLAVAAACGRTGLEEDFPGPVTEGAGDASAPLDAGGGVQTVVSDAAHDVPAIDAPSDASSDPSDVSLDPSIDVANDVANDVVPDVAPDVPPPIDCADAGITYVYLVAADNTLWSFYPPNGAFTPIGTIACPSSSSPFSMGVDRHGIAYVLFTDGALFRVDTADAACTATAFVAGQHGFLTFGMGFSADTNGGEQLFAAQRTFVASPPPSKGLGIIDTATFDLTFVGPFVPTPQVPGMELTGTIAGKLFAYGLADPGTGGAVLEIDKKTAAILSNTPLPVGSANSALAFAYWGGRFYIFTSTPALDGTDVTAYDPANGSLELVLTKPGTIIVGAGVSTCAPD